MSKKQARSGAGGQQQPKCAACGSEDHTDCTGKVQKQVDRIDSGGQVGLAGDDARADCGCTSGSCAHRK